MKYLHGGCGAAPRVLFATHCYELTCLEDRLDEAVTPGQAVVLYDGDTVVGGGTIE